MATIQDDIIFEKQMSEVNKLGNSLLSTLITDGIAENKQKFISRSNLKSTTELAHSYSTEVEKLKSLKAGVIHLILNMKSMDCELHMKLAGKLIDRIDSTLKKHIKYNASQVVTQEELLALNEEVDSLSSISEKLHDINVPEDEVREHITSIEEMKSNLLQITSTLESTKIGVEALQQNFISESSVLLN